MKPASLALAVIAIPAWPQVQSTGKPFKYNGLGYTYFSAGVCHHGYPSVAVGGGGEGFLWRGLTLGLEASYLDFPTDRDGGMGTLTLSPGYHFVNRNKPAKVDPYVSMTVLGLALRSGGVGGAGHLGGGVNYWFKERMGLQFGGQFQVVCCEAMAVIRIGLTFR